MDLLIGQADLSTPDERVPNALAMAGVGKSLHKTCTSPCSLFTNSSDATVSRYWCIGGNVPDAPTACSDPAIGNID